MKHLLQSISLMAIGAFTSCFERNFSKAGHNLTISGEALITTRGGDTIKICDVDVCLLSKDAVQKIYDEAEWPHAS